MLCLTNEKPSNHNLTLIAVQKIKHFLKRIFADNFKLTLLMYGIILAVIIVILKLVEYRYFIHELSVEVYVGAVALLFTILGIWVGLKLINRKKEVPEIIPEIDQETIKKLSISKREYEVLELIAQGLSNQEIADRLFISIPTVKTHSSKLFEKLDVKRRTQAIHKAKSLNIIP